MAEELHFRISSGLKDIIGRDLITDDFVAVLLYNLSVFTMFDNKP